MYVIHLQKAYISAIFEVKKLVVAGGRFTVLGFFWWCSNGIYVGGKESQEAHENKSNMNMDIVFGE